MSCQHRVSVYTDHRSLEYFMSTKILTSKQVRWMEFLSDFNFEIKFTAGKLNANADILSRREQDVAVREMVKRDSRSRVLLGPSRLDPRINAELAASYVDNSTITLSLMDSDTPPTQLDNELVAELLEENRKSFLDLRQKLPKGYTLQDDLLIYQGRLVVERGTVLCTRLIREVHAQPSIAHPGERKTYQLLAPQYYWKGMGADCSQYVANCMDCKTSHSNQLKQQGLLHPLSIPDYPMQHLCMDFKEFP